MRGPHNFLRLLQTAATFERTGASKEILDVLDAPNSVRWLVRGLGWPIQWLGYRGDPEHSPMVRAFYALGPAYVKFGQILSTRADVVGPTMAFELRMLQDRLPPFADEIAKAEIEDALGQPLEAHFSNFSSPVAAASIAQVHSAVLQRTGEKVAIKVLRPNIERRFRRDVDAFHLAASTLEIFIPQSRRLQPRQVIEHFEGVVNEELDLRMEASAASLFRENSAIDEGFQVPRLFWEFSDRRVLTTEWVEGIGLGDVEAIKAAGFDLVSLSDAIIQSFLRHALRDGYFHADMHQGNLKIAPNGDIVALDFGIMGRIDSYTRRVYAEILMGFIQRNYQRVAEVHFEAGYVPADQDVDAFAQALRAVGEPIFGQEANQISMARLLAHLFEVTEWFGMETRTELILLQRTMVVVEGVARTLNPHLNMWEVAKPVVEDYIKDNFGPKAFAKDARSTMMTLARLGPFMPEIIENMAQQARTTKPTPKRFGRTQIGWMLLGAVAASLLAQLF